MFTSRFAICAALFLISSVANAIETRQLHEESLSPKEVAMRFFNALLVNFDEEEAAKYIGPNYIQHNPAVPTGPDAALGLIPLLKSIDFVTINHRFIAEGDLVVAHSTYKNAQPFGANTLVAMDVFRVEDGKVDEHWDCLQQKSGPNPSGRSMTGGRKKIKDLPDDKTMANKALVRSFVETVYIGGDFSNLEDFISSEKFIQHNAFGDGIDTLKFVFAQLFSFGLTFSKLHLIVAEGDFVFTAIEGKQDTDSLAVFNLFRVSKGKIVENWEVVSPIPPPEDFVHDNGFF